jgi:murein DD-endopeptidase MepM/ murein hydrolase activator NlpD
MSPMRGAAATALTIATVLLSAPGAAAIADQPGGVAAPGAPASPQAGGSQFGVPSGVSRPQLSYLRVPASSGAGRPPRIVLELVEPHAPSVYLRVLIIDLHTRRTAVTADMGWVRTSHRLAVVWPRGARVGAGTYRVTVSAHDRRNGNILRNARISGQATLTVKPPTVPVTPPPPASSPEPGVPTPAQTVADGAVFPVRGPHNFGDSENRFGAPRSGHFHEGQDVLTAEGTPDAAPLAGTILTTANQPGGAGYYLVEHSLIGFDFMFAHCEAGSFTVAEGEAVAAGQQVCKAGETGDATAPHLHFEIWVGGWQAKGGHSIDPLPYLEAWEKAE